MVERDLTDTGAAGGNMVFVKVRETYDLHTVKNKMTVIGIHTPKPEIIKKNFPGLLMQCKAYRPVSADVRIACASMLPLDPQGVGLAEGDVAPEDVFNPILYKAMSNKGMSQLEARINALRVTGSGLDVDGSTAMVEVDSFTTQADEFNIYYGLLSDAHGWKHAMPQSGLTMSSLRPLVHEMVYNVGDMRGPVSAGSVPPAFEYPAADGTAVGSGIQAILGKSKPMPFIPCTSYTFDSSDGNTQAEVGFKSDTARVFNAELDVPYIPVVVAGIIVPPSRLHELFYRMVVEWTIEFSAIRTLAEITNWNGLARLGTDTHYQNYSYSAAKEAITGSSDTILESDTCMVSANVDIEKVM